MGTLNRVFVPFSSFVIFHLTANKKLLDTGGLPWCSSLPKPEFVHLIFLPTLSHREHIFSTSSRRKKCGQNKTMMAMAGWVGSRQTRGSVLLFAILSTPLFFIRGKFSSLCCCIRMCNFLKTEQKEKNSFVTGRLFCLVSRAFDMEIWLYALRYWDACTLWELRLLIFVFSTS